MRLRGALVLILGLTPALASERPVLLSACAAHDLHVFTLLEEHGVLPGSDQDALAKAAAVIAIARRACSRGEFARGLDLYASVDLPRTHSKTSPTRRTEAQRTSPD